MRKPIIAGNWKMNKTPSEAKALVNELKPLVKDANATVVVCVPAVDIYAVKEAVDAQVDAAKKQAASKVNEATQKANEKVNEAAEKTNKEMKDAANKALKSIGL